MSREIRPVDSHVAAHLGQALVQRGDHTVKAVRQSIRVLAELPGKPSFASDRARKQLLLVPPGTLHERNRELVLEVNAPLDAVPAVHALFATSEDVPLPRASR